MAHGVDRNEKPDWQRNLNRGEWLKVLLEKIEPGFDCGDKCAVLTEPVWLKS